jgi:hypothetical protein
MVYTVKEFLEKMKDPEFRNRGREKCAQCGEYLKEGEPLGPYKVEKGIVCADCYFKEFGKIIEEDGGIGRPGSSAHGCGDID